MFTFLRQTAAQIESQIAAAEGLVRTDARFLRVDGRHADRVPFLFVQDSSATVVGQGKEAFTRARHAFQLWAMFDLGWVRIANPEARIVANQLVAVEAHTLGLWTLNVSQILEVVESPLHFGFVYATTPLHVEEGEERFLLELDPASGNVTYKLEAVSRPRSRLAQMGYPMTRMFQHRFARDSQCRMREAVRQADTLEA